MTKTVPKYDSAARRRSRDDFLSAGIVFFAAFSVYAWTHAPTVTFIDSGELAVVARTWGVAHPPGFPLWVMLAHFASLVPVANVAARINLSSAFFAALASALTTLVTIEVILTVSSFTVHRRGRRKDKGRENDRPWSQAAIFLPAISGGLLMAFSKTLWSYAIVTEVYALNTALILLIIFLMLRWRRTGPGVEDLSGGPKAIPRHTDLSLYLAAGLFGLALGVHHVTVGLILPALAVLVYRTKGLRFFTSRRLIYAAIISVAALVAVYSYLPIAASHSPLINWGTPTSLKAIWGHLSGRQYQEFLAFEPGTIGEQFLEFGRIGLREFSWAWLPAALLLALAGFRVTFKKDRTLFWFLCVVVAADLGYGFSYKIAEDKDAYYLTTFATFAIAAAVGLQWLFEFIFLRSRRPLAVSTVAALLLLVPPSLALAANWRFNNRRHYWIAHDYVGNILRSVEPHGLLLTFDWQVASPMFYAQQIEHRRTDAKVVDINLLRRSWYFDHLRRVYPDMMARSALQVDAFVTELKHWEQDEAAYADNEALARINSRFEEIVTSFVKEETKIAPVFVTLDFLFAGERDEPLTTSIVQRYGLVPQGLVFKLTSDRNAFHSPPRIRIETRGLNDGTLGFEKDDVVRTRIFPVYTTMMVNRGRYLALFGQYRQAIEAFKEALALDPDLEAAKRALEESERQLPAK